MKQILLGSFGMCLMFGVLLAEWKMYCVTVESMNMKYGMRAIELLLEQRAKEEIEKEEILEMVGKELDERLKNTQITYEVRNCDTKHKSLQIKMKATIMKWTTQPREVIMEKEIAWGVSGVE